MYQYGYSIIEFMLVEILLVGALIFLIYIDVDLKWILIGAGALVFHTITGNLAMKK